LYVFETLKSKTVVLFVLAFTYSCLKDYDQAFYNSKQLLLLKYMMCMVVAIVEMTNTANNKEK